MRPIILASQSPRRKSLLEQAELTFTIRTAHANEDYPEKMEAELVPEFIAGNKALAVLESLDADSEKDAIIIASDTVVILEGEIIGKPVDRADAIAILKRLSGQVHKVVTGVVLQSATKKVAFSDTTWVHFLPLTDSQIVYYVDHYQPMDKAGAYAIQEWIGLIGIEKIDGDFYNVMGLPVNKVLKALDSFAS
jgi:septum formation protein